jgi:NNP family nitrate/nitrite transporter-like MFS transporter
MIPAIFKRDSDAAAAKEPSRAAQLVTQARREGAATLGMAGAFGALGGFILPKTIGDSIKATNGITAAFSWFIAMYVACLVVTWACYIRKSATMAGV